MAVYDSQRAPGVPSLRGEASGRYRTSVLHNRLAQNQNIVEIWYERRPPQVTQQPDKRITILLPYAALPRSTSSILRLFHKPLEYRILRGTIIALDIAPPLCIAVLLAPILNIRVEIFGGRAQYEPGHIVVAIALPLRDRPPVGVRPASGTLPPCKRVGSDMPWFLGLAFSSY